MKNYTRKEFLLGAASGAAGLAAMQMSTAAAAEDNSFESSISWNGLYDVVVIGLGMAGEAAAITAADTGAKVLVLEKAPNGLDGGNSRYCHQVAIGIREGMRESAVTYMKGLRGYYNYPTDDDIEAYIDAVGENWNWFESLGATPIEYAGGAEYPERPGYEGMMMIQVNDPRLGTGAMFKHLKMCIMERSDTVDIWYNAPAKRLIRDFDTGIVIGVTAEVEGREVNIRARNGVVLSSGGYEANLQVMQDYVGIAEAYPIGGRYNTGDGQLMAAHIGAELSAMHNAMTYINCLYDDGVNAEWDSGSRIGKAEYTTSLIYVGADGTRFTNENFKSRHGYMPWHGDFIPQKIPVPAWCVLDEKARLNTYLSKTMSLDQGEAALASGRLLKADSLEELAALINVPAENLTAAVERFNRYADQGEDPEFHRDPAAMQPFDPEGPFYAFRLVQSVLNTQGGPRRNENAQIMDTNGEPIPHLYGAGECGEIFTSCYQGAGNVGGCVAFGRVAGRNAAAPKEDGQPAEDLAIEAFAPTVEEPVYEAGENQHIGIADSHCGDLVLRVTMEGDRIAQVETLHSYDTPNIGMKAIRRLSEAVVGMTAAEAAEIDAVTYATVSSNAFKAAIAAALA